MLCLPVCKRYHVRPKEEIKKEKVPIHATGKKDKKPYSDTQRRNASQAFKTRGRNDICAAVVMNGHLLTGLTFPWPDFPRPATLVTPSRCDNFLPGFSIPCNFAFASPLRHSSPKLLFIAWWANSTPKNVAALAGMARAMAGPKPGKKDRIPCL